MQDFSVPASPGCVQKPIALRLATLAFIFALPLIIYNASTDEFSLKVLNQIQDRHEWVHQQVAPAVVAVNCPNPSKDGMGFYGTGVVISPEGLVLTSSTVVPATVHSVQLFFSDGKVMDARVLATDTTTEACVLQVVHPAGEAKKPLSFVELCDSSKVVVGELAYTAGNPFHTISRDGQVAWSVGSVSGNYKIASADEQSHYHGMILETDAAVNPGSDGGPLIDCNGRLLGILSLCFCESRWLGTAIPAHLIKQSLGTVLKDVPLIDPMTCPCNGSEDCARCARAIPDALRFASRPAANATVKIIVKRSESPRDWGAEHKGSLVRRLRQRPDGPVSGVIFDPEGYILTSAFNIDGDVISFDVQLAHGEVYPATLLGRDNGLDVALLKIQPPHDVTLPTISLAADPELKIGRFVTVLGSSEEGLPTHTGGIISALGRLDGAAVQTDALINYGNSGGPVVDLNGRLIGIASQVSIKPRSDFSQQNSGVGFFAQSDKILISMADLKAGHDIKAPPSPFLGVVSSMDAPETRGVRLKDVLTGSAAASAKLLPGDVIVAVDGMDTHSWPALVRILKAHNPGDTIEITYQRGTVTTRTQTVLKSRDREVR